MNPNMRIRLEPCGRKLWSSRFEMYHYMTTGLNKTARTFLAWAMVPNEDDFDIGFAASLPMPSGTLTNAWRAHKTVVSLPKDHPAEKQTWALVSDVQAQLHIEEGKRFFSMAPIEYAAYRDNPQSGWVPTSKDARRKLRGHRSHEYVGKHKTLIQK